jgi:hypothetical protein
MSKNPSHRKSNKQNPGKQLRTGAEKGFAVSSYANKFSARRNKNNRSDGMPRKAVWLIAGFILLAILLAIIFSA